MLRPKTTTAAADHVVDFPKGIEKGLTPKEVAGGKGVEREGNDSHLTTFVLTGKTRKKSWDEIHETTALLGEDFDRMTSTSLSPRDTTHIQRSPRASFKSIIKSPQPVAVGRMNVLRSSLKVFGHDNRNLHC